MAETRRGDLGRALRARPKARGLRRAHRALRALCGELRGGDAALHRRVRQRLRHWGRHSGPIEAIGTWAMGLEVARSAPTWASHGPNSWVLGPNGPEVGLS